MRKKGFYIIALVGGFMLGVITGCKQEEADNDNRNSQQSSQIRLEETGRDNQDTQVSQHTEPKTQVETEEGFIRVDGWPVEYRTDASLSVEDLEEIELGTSLESLVQQLGEPDAWVGSGSIWPVYSVKENGIVAFHLNMTDAITDIEIFYADGSSEVIKE